MELQDLAAHWQRLKLDRASSAKGCFVMMTCRFNFLTNLLPICLNCIQTEPEASRRTKCAITLNPSSLLTIDLMIKYKVTKITVTSQDLSQISKLSQTTSFWWSASDHGRVVCSKIDSYTTSDKIHESTYLMNSCTTCKNPDENVTVRRVPKQWRPCCTRHTRFVIHRIWCNHVRIYQIEGCWIVI